MRALFIKDLKQGRSLLVFAFAVALLAPAFHYVLVSPRFLYVAGGGDVVVYCVGLALAALPTLIALLAASGLISGESENDTLPVLFALPLGRGQIWVAKVLAGIAVTLLASAIVLGLDVFVLMRHQFSDLAPLFWNYLPDILMWAFFAFSVGMFWTSLMPNLIASIAATIVMAGGLAVGISLLISGLGAPLLGYPPEFDMALWAFLISPALLAASALAVTRGQLLQSRRKYVIAFPVMLVGLAITVVVVCGVVRWSSGYRRSAVRWVVVPGVYGQRVVLATAHEKAREFAQNRWLRLSGFVASDNYMPFPYGLMRGFTIALDLRTGKELVVGRQPGSWDYWGGTMTAAVSRDGRYVAWLEKPTGLTYGVLRWCAPVLKVWDLKESKAVCEREFKEWKDRMPGGMELSWSPSGQYLLLAEGGGGPGSGRALEAYTIRRDGSDLRAISVGYEEFYGRQRPLKVESCYWSPTEDVLIAESSKEVLYGVHPDGRSEPFYKPEGEDETYQSNLGGVSADGRWVTLDERRGVEKDDEQVEEHHLRVVRTDGSGSQVIYSHLSEDHTTWEMGQECWSSVGDVLYAVGTRKPEAQPNPGRRWGERAVFAWRPGEEGLKQIRMLPEHPHVQLTPVPRSEEVLVWAELPLMYEGGEASREEMTEMVLGIPDATGTAFLLNSRGEAQEVRFPGGVEKLVKENVAVGFDDQGRLIIQPRKADSIEALDVRTGKVERIYP